MVKLGVLVSGSGTNLQSIIDSIEAGSLDGEISVVISNNASAYALERARRRGLAVEVIEGSTCKAKADFDRAVARVLKERAVELVVLAGFMRVLGAEFIREFPMRIMNIHPSLLPSFPGLDVHKKAIEHGVRFSGCTVHFVDEGVDSGPIIIQAVVPISADDSADTLAEKILAYEHKLYPEAIQLFSEGRLEVTGRRVIIKGGCGAEGSLVNPPITIFDKDKEDGDDK